MQHDASAEIVAAAYERYPVTPGYHGDKYVDDINTMCREGFIVALESVAVSK